MAALVVSVVLVTPVAKEITMKFLLKFIVALCLGLAALSASAQDKVV